MRSPTIGTGALTSVLASSHTGSAESLAFGPAGGWGLPATVPDPIARIGRSARWVRVRHIRVSISLRYKPMFIHDW